CGIVRGRWWHNSRTATSQRSRSWGHPEVVDRFESAAGFVCTVVAVIAGSAGVFAGVLREPSVDDDKVLAGFFDPFPEGARPARHTPFQGCQCGHGACGHTVSSD